MKLPSFHFVLVLAGVALATGPVMGQPAPSGKPSQPAQPGQTTPPSPASSPVQTPSLAPSSLATLRSGQGPANLHVHAVSMQGVLASEAEEAPKWLAWDQVAGVSGPANAEAAAFLPMAADLWRARARLERGDVPGAEGIFEAQGTVLVGQQGPSSALVASGLMRCALWRGAWASAVRPMLGYVYAIGGGDDDWWPRPAPKRDEVRDIDLGDPLFFDESLGLSPAIPPVFLNLPATRVVANEDWANVAPAGSRAERLAGLYRLGATLEGQPGGVMPERATDDEGLALVWDVLGARFSEGGERSVSRARLRERLLRPHPLWLEVWCKVAIGRSLVHEMDRDQKLMGVAALLEPAARYPREHPYLTGLAMAEAAAALSELGDAEGAWRLKTELGELFPTHPALGWDAIVRVVAPAPHANKDHGGTP